MALSNLELDRLRKNSVDNTSSAVISLMFGSSRERESRHCLAPPLEKINNSQRSMDLPHHNTYFNTLPYLAGDQIGFGGFDLRVGKLISWCDVVIPKVTVQDLLDMDHKVLQEGEKFIFAPSPRGEKVYYVTSFESISYSDNLEILVDSKSTTGRVGAMTHRGGMTSSGKELIKIVQPFSFYIEVECGKTRLSQAVVRYKGTPYMSNQEIIASGEVSIEGSNSSLEKSLNSKGLLLNFDTAKSIYKSKRCDKPINMDAKGEIDWRDYFEIIEGSSKIRLEKETLYLLGSTNKLNLGGVTGFLSREDDVMTGTGAWGHFAGFFQPYFSGQITLEFYSFSNMRLSHGDDAGVVIFDKLDGEVNKEAHTGFYQGQSAPRLPKMFKID